MCGICGIVLKDAGQDQRQRLISMRDTMAHRGPDGVGEYVSPDGRVCFGHRRLSILDLSDAGLQPMKTADGSVWVTFNGEIYNYLELRDDLKARGYEFKTQTDTEVLLYSYCEWGTGFLSRMIGMFAFTIWDNNRRKVLLVRDHIGIKPLYYHFNENELLFSSEIKAILNARPECRTPNYETLYELVAMIRFDHSGDTVFDSVKQLEPGCFIEFDLDNWQAPRPRRYWNLDLDEIEDKYRNIDPVEGFRDLFSDSIRLQMRSDVPVGMFLSGGLDSTSIVALATHQLGSSVHTFSSAYADKAFDEREFIQEAVNAYPVEHKQTMPDSDKLVSDFRKFMIAQEIPTTGSGPFSEWCVAELAQNDVTVLLSGQGPDEMVGGYFPMFDPYLRSRAVDLWGQERFNGLRAVKSEINEISDLTGKSSLYHLASALTPNWHLAVKSAKRLWRDQLHFEGAFREHGQSVPTKLNHFSHKIGQTHLDRYLNTEVLGGHLTRLLHYGDRNTMAFSLEARVPFLDHRLIEFCMQLPYQYKINGSTTKYVLRQALAPHLPEKIRARKDKKGFPTPLPRWLREQEDFVRTLVNSKSVSQRNLFKPHAVERMVKNHMSGNQDNSAAIWRLMGLEVWFQEFIDAAR